MQSFKRFVPCAGGISLIAGVLLSGCATAVAPEDLQVPAQLTCFELATPISYSEERGLLKITWVTRLERGPYVAEREDAAGTFFRAPPGGVSFARPDSLNKPASVLTHGTHDGGIWIPRDPTVPPHLYTYFSTEAAKPVIPPPEANCSNVGVVRDPKTRGVSVVAYGVGGAAGGAMGGVMARSSATGMSYGQAAGVGAAGGLIGGVIVAALINMDVGKITQGPPEKDAGFVAAIRAAAARAMPLRETSASALAN